VIEVEVGQTFIDLGLNFVTSIAGNYLGSKMIPTNSGWFQTKKFLSVFTKPYGQKNLNADCNWCNLIWNS